MTGPLCYQTLSPLCLDRPYWVASAQPRPASRAVAVFFEMSRQREASLSRGDDP